MRSAEWQGLEAPLARVVTAQSDDCLGVYRRDHRRVDEDLATEISTAEGGYGRKQLYELVQNGADAMRGQPGRIEIELTEDVLYVANQGEPFDENGIHGLMAARLSNKREDEIGRFGLGFKSVVAITDSPQVFSRSVSFGFDRAAAAHRIHEVVPGRIHYPLLRLAQPLDPVDHAASDLVLSRMMKWATTVVRLPLKNARDFHALVADDMSAFPAEFVLFSPHVSQLRIIDRLADESRTIELIHTEDGLLELRDRDSVTRWRVTSEWHNPSPEAARDAGELAHRERIQLQWAVPMQSRNRLGEFWAFFPTGARTTLSGIVNAPWKMSDDRRSLLEGAFNRELLEKVLPKLIADVLPGLADADDPAAVLDLLPARGREVRSWADEVVNGPVFETLASRSSLPASDGEFRRPRDLALAPKGLGEGLLADWVEVSPSKGKWAHPGVDRTPERRLKAERLMAGEGVIADARAWLEALCAERTLQASANAVVMASRLVVEKREFEQDVRHSRILLLEDGTLASPRPGTVFVRTAPEEKEYQFIEPALVEQPGVRSALYELGIRILDRGGELRNALSGSQVDWGRVWQLASAVPIDAAVEIFSDCLPDPLVKSVQVRSAAGRWIPISGGFLAGGVVPVGGSGDRDILIDPRYHGAHEDLLTRLGAVQKPALRPGAPEERWLTSYRDILFDTFIASKSGAKPAKDKLRAEGPMPPWPLENLQRMSDTARAAMTEAALRLDDGEPWTVFHVSNRSYGKARAQDGPVTWWVKQHGRLTTSLGPWPVSETLSADSELPADVLPVADVAGSVAERLGLLTHPNQLSQQSWSRILAKANDIPEPQRRYLMYAWAVHFAETPETIVVGDGLRKTLPPAKVAVSADEHEYQVLTNQRIPVILAEDPDDKAAFITRWGMADGAQMLQQELMVEPAGESVPLLDAFPGLRAFLASDQRDIVLQPCRSLTLLTATPGGQISQAVPGLLQGDRVLVTATRPDERLAQISNALNLELDDEGIRSILSRERKARVRRLMAEIRAAEGDAHRLAIAVGADALRRAVPEPALRAIELERARALSVVELGEMAIAVHGVAVLRHFRDVLERRGLNPPQQWSGRSTARRFVAELGFPVEYAGFPADRRPAVFEVDGPATLAPLHDYQILVTENIKQVVRGERGPRAMVSLPTGAGKTRVVVQALVEEIRDTQLHGSVVWIAQSDELCEQAVQTWAHIWRALGPNQRLVISRFWSTNDVSEEPEHFQLIVATPDKLRTVVEDDDYSWLADAPVVVVDEAHRSIAPEYTRVLNWLGRARRSGDDRPLIGLTATPFRNVNVEETKRLASRYGGQRLDEGAFAGDPYRILQDRSVLAQVEHELLPGVDVRLTQKDRDEIRQLLRVPSAIEEQLGANIQRNIRIVESIAGLPKDWTVLLFATSVENSRTLAAQLSARGIPAVSISGQTEPAARRRYVDEFKEGRIRVITNYNVLSQGFDAPAVRAVYVTRPTFSANLYQQMIGRGLRGPLNGGSEEVLIVNVKDNFEAFGEQLAFYHFDHLWGAGNGTAA